MRELPTINGYTVDIRLQQFRRVTGVGDERQIEFVEFTSPKGHQLLAELKDFAMEVFVFCP